MVEKPRVVVDGVVRRGHPANVGEVPSIVGVTER